MPDIQKLDFSPDKIKIRWEEPYVSEGLNRKLSALPPGIYRGASCAESAVPNKSFRFGPDLLGYGVFVDTLIVWQDLTANGHSLIVHDSDIHSIDMSARFTGGGGSIPANETWYVWLDCVYTLGAVTTATLHVTLTAPPVGAVKCCRINMLLGDTTIVNARFSVSDSSSPAPTTRRVATDHVLGDNVFGLIPGILRYRIPSLNQKDGLDNAPHSANASNPFVTKADTLDKILGEPREVPAVGATGQVRFQLTGWYYIGNGPPYTAEHYFELHKSTSMPGYRELLTGSDGHVITVLSINIDAGGSPGAETNPAIHADANGFIQNPWVFGDFSKTVDTAFSAAPLVWCTQKTDLLNLTAGSIPDARRVNTTHADLVNGGSQTGTPDALAAGTVSTQSKALLDLINARIRKYHPDVTPAHWALLWRSKELPVDTDVTKDTVSIYFGRFGGLLFLVGGYIDTTIVSPLVHAGTGASSLPVMAIYMKDGMIQFLNKNAPVAAGSTWLLLGGWDTTTVQGSTGVLLSKPLYPYGGAYWQQSLSHPDAFSQIEVPGLSTVKYEETVAVLAGAQARRYYKQNEMWFAINCSYDATLDKWHADSGSNDAFVMKYTPFGFEVWKKSTLDGIGTDWLDSVSGWTSVWRIGVSKGASASSLSCAETEGDVYEAIRFGWSGLSHMTIIHTGMVCNYKVKRSSVPADFTIASGGSHPFINNIQWGVGPPHAFSVDIADIFDIDEWGFRVGVEAYCIVDDRFDYDNLMFVET